MRVICGMEMLSLVRCSNYKLGTVAYDSDGIGYWTKITSGWMHSITKVIRGRPDTYISRIEEP